MTDFRPLAPSDIVEAMDFGPELTTALGRALAALRPFREHAGHRFAPTPGTFNEQFGTSDEPDATFWWCSDCRDGEWIENQRQASSC